MRLGDIASALGGRLLGDAEVDIERAASLESADAHCLAILANPRYRARAMQTRAAALVMSESMAADHAHEFPCPVIAVTNPLLAMAEAVRLLWSPPQREIGISELAYVHPEAELGDNVAIMPFAHVGRARIGAGSRIFPYAFVDDEVVLGSGCEIRPGCVLMYGTRLGDRVILQPGAVLGADGFGYASDGVHHAKIPQIGHVEIGDDVEIGALTAIDRGSMDPTRVGRGSKFDNLVQIGHNVQIGQDVILVSQVGIAGSTTVKDRAVIAGKVGIKDHVTIGEDARIGAFSAVGTDIPDQGAYSGIPAMPHGAWLRIALHLKNLEKTVRRLREVERRLDRMEAQGGDSLETGSPVPPAEVLTP
ncbi:MAG: UDP-3-O-(3-hydroxymyristoyl)glucosamine N-acyltransferase [Pseudomonadota bacterium]